MSSAGTIFKERVRSGGGQGSGSETYDFDVENDGVLVTVHRVSGTATITTVLATKVADSTLIEHGTLVVSTSTPGQLARATGGRISLALSWDDTCEFLLTVKAMSAAGVDPSSNSQLISDEFTTAQLNVSTTEVQLTNAEGRRTVAIKNWSDPVNNQVLYVGSSGTGTDGWPLTAREGLSLAIDENASLYMTASSGTIDTRIIQITEA